MEQTTALITGASSGIGRELARVHAQRGGDLILVARRQHLLDELKTSLTTEHGIKVHVIAQDLSEPGAAQAVHNAVQQSGTTVDVLINNAGFGGVGRFHEQPWQDNESMVTVNVLVLAALTRLFLPEFVARGSGRILNVSSTASLVPGPNQAVYFASKAFVTSFSNAIAQELRGTGVTVTALLPGATATEFASVSGMEETRLFAHTVDAYTVALDGYKAMLRGKLNQFSALGFGQRMAMRLAPLLPRRFVLRTIQALQESH